MYTSRGCPAMCTFCLWPQTHSGHRWRLRSSDDIRDEVKYALEAFPHMKEIFFDDDTFNYRKERTIELCAKLKPLNFTWSCTSRVTTDYDTLKAMKEAGCRLLIVGYESGDPQILKNIKKGATIDMAERFTANCKKLGLVIHGDFIVGLPGETRESIRKTIDFAKKLDNETIQVSIAHPYPGTEFYDYAKKNNLISIGNIVDERGNQLPKVVYENLNEAELMDWVERFYSEYYFRTRVIWRMVRKVIFNSHDRQAAHQGSARIHGAARPPQEIHLGAAAADGRFRECRRLANADAPKRGCSRSSPILSNVAGNSLLTKGMQQLGGIGNSPLALIGALVPSLGRAGRRAADCLDPDPHGAAQLGGSELCDAGHRDQLCRDRLCGAVVSGRNACRPTRWVGIVLITAGVTLVGRTAAATYHSALIEGRPR